MHLKAELDTVKRIMEDNDSLASENQKYFNEQGIVAFNFMSAPGAGKTTLITETILELKTKYTSSVLVGDMVSDIDAQRFQSKNITADQISTGRSCHLDASMIASKIDGSKIGKTNVLFIENVGNLVCPAEFQLGEHRRIVLLSVTEGDDKPIKYPVIFQTCNAVVLTKCDLLDYVNFDTQKVAKSIEAINPGVALMSVSCKTGAGIAGWTQWLSAQIDLVAKDLN